MKKALICCSILALALATSAGAVVIRSSSPGLAITSSTCVGTDGTGGVTDTIVYSEVGTISDVNVRTEIVHTWRGDLQFHVAYTGGGGNVVLAADHDGSADDYFATFDDESANGLCSLVCGAAGACEAGTPTNCVPNQALSAFDTLASPGTWTMAVCDDAGGDEGTFNTWEMQVNGAPGDGLPVELSGSSIE